MMAYGRNVPCTRQFPPYNPCQNELNRWIEHTALCDVLGINYLAPQANSEAARAYLTGKIGDRRFEGAAFDI
jgi:hypothetical protein